MKCLILFAILVQFGGTVWAAEAAPATSGTLPAFGADRPLVGMTYFAGWWETQPNKWHIPAGHDWRADYPERVPLLGEYNDQPTMDREIVAAAGHGVDWFLILWYFNDPNKPPAEPGVQNANRGLSNFIASPEAHRMKFAIEFCNHPPFLVETDEAWERCIDAWMPAFRHPSYLRVGGRLVFKVHSGHHFYVMENDRNAASCQKRLNRLRQRVAEAGLGEMVVGFGTMAEGYVGDIHPLKAPLFDFSATYMDMPALPQKPEDFPYADLAAFIGRSRLEHVRKDVIPYMPFVAAGWNCRPWRYPDRPSFAFPTPEEWTAELRRIKADLENNPRLGIPLPDGPNGEKRTQKIFNIYAWNEFGEGGIVAPTRGRRYMMLEGIKEVFGTK